MMMIIMIEDCMVEDKPSPQHECDSPMTVRFKGVRSGGAQKTHGLFFCGSNDTQCTRVFDAPHNPGSWNGM